jgi:membrane protease YdiL (CAAX protease family)
MEKRTPISFFIVLSFLVFTGMVGYFQTEIIKLFGLSLKSFGVLSSLIELSFCTIFIKTFFKGKIAVFKKNSWKINSIIILLFPLMFIVSIPVNLVHENLFKRNFSSSQSSLLAHENAEEKLDKTGLVENRLLKNTKDIGFFTVSALGEEVTYRAMLISFLLLVVNPFSAIIISSFLFGLSHLWPQLGYEPSLFVSSFLVMNSTAVGTVLGFVYTRSGLFASFTFHLLANLAVQYIRPNPIYWKQFCIVLALMASILGIILIFNMSKSLKNLMDKHYKKKSA